MWYIYYNLKNSDCFICDRFISAKYAVILIEIQIKLIRRLRQKRKRIIIVAPNSMKIRSKSIEWFYK